MLVVEVAGLFIAEDLVGLRDGFELFVGFFALLVGDFVGVGCERSLERVVSLEYGEDGTRDRVVYFVVCLFDLSLRRRALYLQDLYAC